MIRTDDLSRVTWSCIHFGAEADVTPELRAALESEAIVQFDLHVGDCQDRDDLLRGLAEAMQFPDYFGMNWDAVIDCLRDLDDRVPAEGYVLFVHSADVLWQRQLKATGDFVEVWLTAAEEVAHDGVPLHLVFLSGAAQGQPG